MQKKIIKKNHKDIKKMMKENDLNAISNKMGENLKCLADFSKDEFVIDYANRLIRQLELDFDYAKIIFYNYKKLYHIVCN